MGIFDKFRKKEEKKLTTAKPKKVERVAEKKVEKKKVEKKIEKPKEVVKAKARIGGASYRILLKPQISEKATILSETGKYVFYVHNKSTKAEVKQAVKDVYGVKSIKVNFINVGGKKRRYGASLGKTSDFKKAVITLAQGKAIEVYEGT